MMRGRAVPRSAVRRALPNKLEAIGTEASVPSGDYEDLEAFPIGPGVSESIARLSSKFTSIGMPCSVLALPSLPAKDKTVVGIPVTVDLSNLP
jgi:hypothetical protein